MTSNNCRSCSSSSGFKVGKPTGKPIPICDDMAESCFTLAGKCKDLSLEDDDIKMIISNASNQKPLIEYPAFTVEDSTVCFYWDSLLYELEAGRYLGDIEVNGQVVAQVQFEQSNSLSIESVTHTERKNEVNCE